MVKKREYGIELLRILSMLGIVGLHVLNAGGGLKILEDITLNSTLMSIIISFCYCSVNIFAMMTGYLYAEKKIVRYANILKLIATVFFYCLAITIIGLFVWKERFSGLTSILVSIFPIFVGRYWYIVCYVLLFVLIPFINILIHNMTKKQYTLLIIIMFVFTSIIPTVTMKDLFAFNSGYSTAWLVICYLIGAYVKLHFNNIKSNWFYGGVVLFNIVLDVGVYFVGHFVGFKGALEHVVRYISPLTVVNATMCLVIFRNIQIKNKLITKVLSFLGSKAFDVYILHANMILMDVFISNKFGFVRDMNALLAVIVVIGSLVVIYFACVIIGCIKELLFKYAKINWLLEKLGRFFDKHLQPNEKSTD